MYQRVLAIGHKGFLIVEDWLNRVFSPRFNPMYYLGAIAFLFTWLVIISGLYLLFFYRISVEHAYDSLNTLNWFNRIFRSLHRYASDGAMAALLLHLLREFFNDRYRNWRWVAWVTGVVILFVYWLLGITGYWMVWDQRSQLIARMTAEFLDFIPIFGEPMTRAFLSNDTVTSILFIGVIFLHLSVPTLALFFLWLHVIRISRPVVNPPKALVIALISLTIAVCIIYPAASVERADLNIVAARFGIDWLYLVLFPVLASAPVRYVWLVAVIGTGILAFLPWSIRRGNPAKAKVVLPNCVGCELCFKDCPYEAIYMRKRTDGLPYNEEAVVVEARCASCGLCVGACDYQAIEFPGMTEEMINEEITRLMSAGEKGELRILNVSCGYGIDMKALIDPNTRALKNIPNVKVLILPCVGMLQPAMIEHAFRAGADGVFISGCQANDCHFREGDRWLEDRLYGRRPPFLRKKDVEPSLVRAGWFSPLHAKEFLEELRGFFEDIKGQKKEARLSIHRYARERLTVPGVMVFAIAAFIVLLLSNTPYTFFVENDSMLRFSFKHGGRHIKEEKVLSEDELKKLPPHMRARVPKAGPRHHVYAEVEIDGKKVLAKIYKPSGLRGEGASYAHEKVVTTPGIHKVTIRMSDAGSREQFDYTYEKVLEFRAGRQICIDFNEVKKTFFIRD